MGRFMDEWSRFYGRQELYARNGLHFSRECRSLVSVLRGKLGSPVRETLNINRGKGNSDKGQGKEREIHELVSFIQTIEL